MSDKINEKQNEIEELEIQMETSTHVKQLIYTIIRKNTNYSV